MISQLLQNPDLIKKVPGKASSSKKGQNFGQSMQIFVPIEIFENKVKELKDESQNYYESMERQIRDANEKIKQSVKIFGEQFEKALNNNDVEKNTEQIEKIVKKMAQIDKRLKEKEEEVAPVPRDKLQEWVDIRQGLTM